MAEEASCDCRLVTASFTGPKILTRPPGLSSTLLFPLPLASTISPGIVQAQRQACTPLNELVLPRQAG
jgi:hypothetical protein